MPFTRARCSRVILFCALALLPLAQQAAAYVRSPDTITPQGQPVFRIWGAGDLPIRFLINDQTSDALLNIEAGSDPVNAVRASFQTWQNVPTSSLAFTDAGLTSLANAAMDRINVVSFVDSQTSVGGALAVTITTTAPEGGNIRLPNGQIISNTFPGQILDADIVFNRSQVFSTLGSENANDLQSVTTHEVGHLVGLDHATLLSATMLPFTRVGTTFVRSVDFDDAFAISVLYPLEGAADISASRGMIAGRVIDGAGNPVFGANVVAVDQFGRSLVGKLTLPDGAFLLDALFPGPYTLFVEPLDGPVTADNFLQFFRVFEGAGATSSPFATTFLGSVDAPISVTVEAQQTRSIDLQVGGASGATLNITDIGLITRSGRSTSISATSSLIADPGSELILTVMGPGINSNSVIRISDPEFTVTADPESSNLFPDFFARFGGGVAVRVNIPATAQPGGRNVIASNGTAITVASNGLAVSGDIDLGKPGGDQGTPPPDVGAEEPPAINLSLNQSVFSTGDTLRLTSTTTPGSPAVVDLYLAALLPDGTLLFLGPSISSNPAPFRSSATVSTGDEALFTFQFNGLQPTGRYQLLAGFTAAGVNPFDGLVSNVAGVTFEVLSAAAQTAACAPQPISSGASLEANLSSNDCRASQRSISFADQYTFAGAAGQSVSISMTSPSPSSLNPLLFLLDSSGAVVTFNDDISQENLNALIEDFALPRSDTFTIEATTFQPDQTGQYSLTLQISGGQ